MIVIFHGLIGGRISETSRGNRFSTRVAEVTLVRHRKQSLEVNTRSSCKLESCSITICIKIKQCVQFVSAVFTDTNYNVNVILSIYEPINAV